MSVANQRPIVPWTPNPAGYLTATSQRYYPGCGNSEGWGPLSPDRFDFTPCFLDVWITAVAAFGIFFGATALWYLTKRCPAQPVKKNWHFYAKLVYSPSPPPTFPHN